VPALTRVTIVPDTVQMAVELEVNAIGSPELAVAFSVNGGFPTICVGTDPNAMVCTAATKNVARLEVLTPAVSVATTVSVWLPGDSADVFRL